MANPLYNMIGNPTNNFLSQFQQFRQTFGGDPKQAVENLLKSGRISQQQYDRAVQMARQFQQFIK